MLLLMKDFSHHIKRGILIREDGQLCHKQDCWHRGCDSMTENGSKLVLNEVRYVPEMGLNFILIGKLDEVGIINQFDVSRWKLSRGSTIVARAKKEGSLYIIQGNICKWETNVAQDATKELWHKKLGHTNEKGLEFLAKDHFPNIKG